MSTKSVQYTITHPQKVHGKLQHFRYMDGLIPVFTTDPNHARYFDNREQAENFRKDYPSTLYNCPLSWREVVEQVEQVESENFGATCTHEEQCQCEEPSTIPMAEHLITINGYEGVINAYIAKLEAANALIFQQNIVVKAFNTKLVAAEEQVKALKLLVLDHAQALVSL